MKAFYFSFCLTLRQSLLLLILTLGIPAATMAQFSFSDNATNYGGTWANGNNFGTGYNAWSITTGGANSGTFIGNPAGSGVNNANIGATSFALFGHSGQYVNTTRYFGAGGTNVPMLIGDVFSFYWGMNWDCGSSGSKGFDLRADGTTIFNVNNSNTATISTTNGNAFTAFGTNAMLVTLTRTSWTQYSFSMTARDGGATFNTTITSSANINNINMYCGAQQDNNGNRNIFFNAFNFTKAAPYETNFDVTDPRVLTGTNNLTKTGAGNLTLTGVNTFSGNVIINNNFVIITNDNQLGAVPGSPTASKIQLGGGALAINASITINANRGIALNSTTSTIDVFGANTATYNGIITGAAGNTLTKNGPGTLVLGGANTYAGNTSVANGILQLGAANVIPDGSNVTLNGGTLRSGAITGFSETAGTLNLNATSTLALGTGAHTLTFANSSAVSWAGGYLFVTGWAGSFNGTAGTAGRLFVGNTAGGLNTDQLVKILFLNGSNYHTATILSTGEVVPTASVAMFWNGTTVASWTGANAWSLNPTGPYNQTWVSGRAAYFNLATNNITGASTNTSAIVAFENVTVTAGGTIGTGLSGGGIATIYVASGRTFNFGSQTISSAAGTGIIKNGPGILNMGAAGGSTMPGGYTINQGIVAVGGNNAMGTGTLTINGGTIVNNSGTTRNPANASIVVNADFGLGDIVNFAAGTGNLVFSGTVSLGSSATRTITLGAAATYALNGAISGTGSNLVVNATAAGTLSLGGANTYGGNTTINGGTVLLTTGANRLPVTTGLTLANTAGAILNLNNFAQTVASLSGGGATGGNITTGGTSGVLTVNQSSSTTYAGVISGTGALTKSGTGTLTLSGVNSYTGLTTITGGTIQLGAANVLANTSNVVLNGGTLSTGASAGFDETVGTLNLSAASTISLGTGVHSLTFAASNGVTWTGPSLVINGWTGTAGSSGTAGRIFFGNTTGTLTAGQLALISFTGFPGTPILLGTGELVPPVPPITFTWNGSASADWTNSANWTPSSGPSATPGATDLVVIPDVGSYTTALSITGAQSCLNFTVDADGTYAIAAAGSLTVSGTYAYNSSTAATFDCTSTLTISGSTSSTIPAGSYGNLNLSGGPRTLSGTINICGNYTPSAGVTTVTGSTVNFNGTTAQAINTNAATFATLNITNTAAIVTANANVTTSVAMTINSSAIFRQASGTLTVSGATVNVNGTLRNSSTTDIAQAGATVTVGSTGTYDHNRNGGALLSATWSAGSTCMTSGTGNTVPTGLGQSFSDFTWSQVNTTNINLNSALVSVGRDLRFTYCVDPTLISLSTTAALTLNVGRDLIVSDGRLVICNGNNTNATTVNVGRDLIVTGGTTGGSVIVAGSSASNTGIATLAVTGSISLTSTSLYGALVGTTFTKTANITCGGGYIQNNSTGYAALSSLSAGNATMTISSGDFTLTSGTFAMTHSGSSGACVLNLNGGSSTMNINGGTLHLIGATTGPSTRPIINLAGNFSQTNGNVDFAPTYAGSQNPAGEIVVSKNFTRSGTGYIRSTSSINNGRITFATGAQTYSSSATGNFLRTNITINSGSTLTLGSDIVFDNTTTPVQTLTISSGGALICGTNLITNPGGTGTSASVVVSSGASISTANAAGLTASGSSGSVQTGVRSYSSLANYAFNGGAGQVTGNFSTTTTPTTNAVADLTVNNSSDLTLSSAISVNDTLKFVAGNFIIGNNDLTTAAINGFSAARHVKTTGTGQLKQCLGTPCNAGAVVFPVGNAAYNPITLTHASTFDTYGVRVIDGAVANANDATKAVNRSWVVTEGVAGGSSLSVVAQYNTGEEGANFNAGTNPKVGFYKGSAPWVEQSATVAGSNPFTYTATGSFSPTDLTTGTQYFAIGKDDAFNAPVTTFSWNGSTDSNWGTASNWTPNAIPSSTDNVIIDSTGTNMLSITSARTVNNFTLSGTGNFTVTSSGSLTIDGTVTSTSSATPSLDCASTVSITSTTSQTIPAWTFGNLNATGGNRTFSSSGTIVICGSFTRGAGTYTVTGSTVDFNGTGAQTIPAGTYNNLTISQNRGGATVTLATGTIDVAGSLNPTVSNYANSYAGNTINFSGAGSQNIPAFNYNIITNTGNGNRVWANSGVIDINGTFTPGTGTHTVTGSTVRYSSTSATAYTLTSFTSSAAPRHYNNLELVGGASTTWSLPSGFNMGCAGNFSITGSGTFTVNPNTTAITMTVDGSVSVSGNGLLRVVGSSGAGTLNVGGNFTNSSGGTDPFILANGTGLGTMNVTGNFSTSAGQVIILNSASNAQANTLTITGNLNISGSTFSGIDLENVGSTSGSGVIIVGGDFNATSTSFSNPGIVNFGTGTSMNGNRVTIAGNFTKSGTGEFYTTGTPSSTPSNHGFIFNKAGTQTFSYTGASSSWATYTVNVGSTLQLLGDFAMGTAGANDPPVQFNVNGTLDMSSFRITGMSASSDQFNLNAGATLITAHPNGINNGASTSALGGLTTSAAKNYSATANYVFNGSSSQNTNFPTAVTTMAGLTINNSNGVTLNKAITVSNAMTLTNGLFYIGNFDLTLSSAVTMGGAPFSSSKMIVTNGNGFVIRSHSNLGVGIPFSWPIGDTTGVADYSPVTVNNITVSIAGTLGFRVVDGVHPNMSPASSYTSRYWPSRYTGGSPYNYTNATFTYTPADIVMGPETSLKSNVWDPVNAGWLDFSATSSAASNVLTLTSGPNQANMPASGSNIYDHVARIDVPVYYRSAASNNWTNASTTWEISTDPAFVSPAPVPATVAPNPANSAGITIRNGHTVTVNTSLSADQLVIQSGGILSVTANSFTVANGTGTDLTVDSGGTIQFSSSTNNSLIMASNSAMQVNGLFKQMSSASPDFTINSGAAITVGATGTYEHARNAGVIPACTWSPGSTCLLTGITNNMPSGLGQSFQNFTVNSSITASVNCSGALQTVLGKMKVTTNHPTNEFRLSTGTTFTLTVTDSLIIDNGFVSIASGGAGPCNIVVNGHTLVTNNSTLAKTGAATANFTFNGNYQQDVGSTFEFNDAGSSNTTVNFRGNVVWNGTILRTNGGTHTVNFDKASGLQTWTSNATYGSGLINWNIGTGSTTNTVQLLSDISLSTSAHVFNVRNGSTFNMGPYVLTGTNTAFTLNATGGIKLGHAAGIVTAPTADGNVRTLTRNFPGTASYFYNGAANQSTGNALPTTLTTTGNLNIEASTGVVVTLTNNNTSTPTFNLISGLFAAGNTQQLNITSGGTVNATGGDWVTGANAGLLNFPGTGTFTGNSNPYNVYISGGVNFGSGTVTIQNGGTFRINSGGFVNTNAPFYAVGSTLQYWVNTTYGRGLEWSASSGRGFPHHVNLGNNSLLNPADVSAVDANVPFRTGGDVSIDLNSAIYMDFSGNNMIEDLIVGGNLSLTGQLSGSGSSGSDIFVAGNWINDGSGTNFFPNNRAVFLNGTGNQTISGTNSSFPAFPFLFIDKTTGGVGLNRDIQVSNTLTFTASNVANISAGAFTVFVSNNALGSVVRTGSGHVIGNLRRAIATGTATYNFTVGDSTAYAPVSVTANGVTVAGTITASTANPDHPQIASSGLDGAKSVNRYWSLSQTGLTLTSFDPTFNFVSGDIDGGVNTNNLLVGRYNAGWTYPTVGTRTATSTQATGLTGYGDFALGECKTPALFAVTGGGSYCSGSGGVAVGLAGSEPFVSYQLQINGVDTLAPVIGTGAAINFGNMTSAGTYTVEASNLASFGCLSNMTGSVEITIIPTVTPAVSISSTPAGSVCAGTSVSFNAVGQFGGVTPTYQWQLNGSNVGTNSTSYNLVTPVNGDVVRCIFTSSEVCPAPASDTSNVITMTVLAFQTPSVSIVASPSNNICAGDNVTFTATPTFGGGTPSYQWRLNGANVGANSPTYSNAALATGDQVDCILTSDYQCLLTPTANSNVITMTVTPAPQVNAGSAMTTCGLSAYTFANGASNSNTTGIVWTENGAGSITSGSTTLTPTYTPAAGDIGNVVTFTLTGTGTAPCGTVIDQVTLTVTPLLNWFLDADGDGFGAPGIPVVACTNPGGRVTNNQDCCDTNADVNPLSEWWADIDGDGYGSFVFDIGCFTGVGCSTSTWFGLIPYYPGAHSGIPYALDCNDNDVSVNPGINEVCGNNTDDDCNGTIDVGCNSPQNDAFTNAISVTVNNPNAYYPNCQILNGSVTNAGISTQGNPANVSVGAGRDVWYRFQAPSAGVQIKVQPVGFDAVIELRTAAHPVGQVDVENANNTVGGLEILNTVSLTAGTIYYVGVRNFNATNTGTFTICISPLLQSGCGLPVPVGGFSTCANYKAIYRGAATYTFNFTGTGGTAPLVTTVGTTAGLIPLTTPALNIRYGGIYSCRVDANYALVNGVGAPEPLTMIGSTATANCTNIQIMNQPNIEVRSTQRCPAAITRSTFLVGTAVSGNTIICGATGYRYRFTKVTDCTGTTTAGLPFTQDTPGNTPFLNLAAVFPTSLPNIGYWRVEIAPIFSYGLGNYGPVQVIQVTGTSTSMMLPETNDGLNATKMDQSLSDIGLYPNPNNGEMVNVNLTGLESNQLDMVIYDAMGKLVQQYQFAVEESFNTILVFNESLVSGVYTIEFRCGNQFATQRMVVQN